MRARRVCVCVCICPASAGKKKLCVQISCPWNILSQLWPLKHFMGPEGGTVGGRESSCGVIESRGGAERGAA